MKSKYNKFQSSIIASNEDRKEYFELLVTFIFILLITMYFPSVLMIEFNPIFQMYREPWSKFGPIYIIVFGKIISLALSILYKNSKEILIVQVRNTSLATFMLSISLMMYFNFMNPDRVPTSSFDKDYKFTVNREYAEYVSKKSLKINHILNRKSKIEHALCIIPGDNLYSDIVIGRWFIAYSKNIPHFVEQTGSLNLGSNSYSQLGKIVDRCGNLQIESKSSVEIINICLPSYYNQSIDFKKLKYRYFKTGKRFIYCDYNFKQLPLNPNLES
jgi:hypothetical protein